MLILGLWFNIWTWAVPWSVQTFPEGCRRTAPETNEGKASVENQTFHSTLGYQLLCVEFGLIAGLSLFFQGFLCSVIFSVIMTFFHFASFNILTATAHGFYGTFLESPIILLFLIYNFLIIIISKFSESFKVIYFSIVTNVYKISLAFIFWLHFMLDFLTGIGTKSPTR